jgi:D-glycero-D-manno-heptose 1,7-bisphosphate phosphatase
LSQRPAIFFDRDGVLNEVVWRDGKPASPRSPDELVLAGDCHDTVGRLRSAGFLTFVVTNQPDVRRGLMTADSLEAIHRRLGEEIAFEEIACCPHDDRDHCGCRKPRPGMLLDLARRWSVDLTASWMIGDQDRDTACGQAAGCRTALLSRPYNSGAGADINAAELSLICDQILASLPLRHTA